MDIRFDSIPPIQIVILVIVMFTIFFIVYLEPKIRQKKPINKKEHGSSKFADMKEIKGNFKCEDINNINEVGFPVWYEKETSIFRKVYFDTKSPHYLLVGSTGAGKSATVSIPMSYHFAIAKDKHSVVLTDPKGELFMKTGKVFEENGYDVITIDFRNPTMSAKINIMQPIIDEWKEHCHFYKCMMFFLLHFIKTNKISLTKLKENSKYEKQMKEKYNIEDYIIEAIKTNYDELLESSRKRKIYNTDILSDYTNDDAQTFLNSKSNEEILDYIKDNQNKSSKHQAETNRLVISLANLIFTEKETKDPFWINAAKQLFIGIVGIFIEDYKAGLISENKINISSVKKFQNSSLIKTNQSYLQKNLNTRKYGSLSKDYLTSIVSAAENTYKSITAIFGEKMSIFDDLNVENITSISEFNFTDIGKKPTALYIIVPDEDRAYFQLVTIIIGMLIKDLTKFANLTENHGTLPIKIEWILDEFANCPPLDAIETVVSVARSRGMRFYFFIQSFSQLDQVYGKEIANIIQDNCALVYLKTNTVETAEVIAKKLGKETVETNSVSMSTDVRKIGANQTKSLMGKELLTANEIMGLKYKTIIFPTFGNPIFRDTYMYSDLYPQYNNYPICEREVKVLKRLQENYYTLEKLKENYDKIDQNRIDKLTKQITDSFETNTNRKIKRIKRENNKNNPIFDYIQSVRIKLKDKIVKEYKTEDEVYSFKLSTLLNKFEISKIKENKKENIMLEVAMNYKDKTTMLSIWDNDLEIHK